MRSDSPLRRLLDAHEISLSVLSDEADEAEVDALFDQFMRVYNKGYDTAEEKERRKAIFKKNISFLQVYNQTSSPDDTVMDITEFADMTPQEFETLYLRDIPLWNESLSILDDQSEGASDLDERIPIQNITDSIADGEDPAAPEELELSDKKLFGVQEISEDQVPEEVNWVAKGAVTTPGQQGSCGACYTFSSTAALEGLHYINTGELVALSQQQALDCAPGNLGCTGGWPEKVLAYLAKSGAMSKADYPYTGRKGSCRRGNSVASISGFKFVEPNNEKEMMRRVAMQPVSVLVEANSGFMFYRGGVYSGPCGTRTNHAVTIVGYGTENGKPYWLIKNSWGTNYGVNGGYIKMARGRNACGIASSVVYPVSA
jgi:C1A family cysteine protease